ncbi:melanocortin-2 receptor accessory protein [Morphnus guianensis]
MPPRRAACPGGVPGGLPWALPFLREPERVAGVSPAATYPGGCRGAVESGRRVCFTFSVKSFGSVNLSEADSIVIAFWVGLAAFVTFLFLILLYMSRSGSTPVKQVIVGNQIEESSSNGKQPHCDDLSSPYSDVVASQTPTSLSYETGIHERI